ncbi:putative CRINKLY4 related 3 [Tripterygium wilfordii]|uniref:non-specific serine/threonine protein kinase n=1 Tax=Tripterygium wilfordii TaxID=458696 RepID=A0A7J7DDQ9_TRIWF|nr:putative CRINKLY4 related 3 [Tripterygium wilfordii]
MTVAFFSLPFVFIISLLIGGHEVLVNGLGSASTITVIYGTATFCGIIAGEPTQRIQCFQDGKNISVQPKVSFESISGGFSFFCGLRSGGYSILCWDTTPTTFNLTFQPKRIYFNYSIRLTDLTVGYDHLCAREINSGVARCWRGGENGRSLVLSPGSDLRFSTITSGRGFSCGILRNNSRVSCWGNRDIGAEIQNLIGNLTMSNLVAGDSHVCGITRTGILVCQGRNESGQLDVPFSSAYEFSDLALGANFSCAIRQRNGLVLCWGGRGRTQFNNDLTETVSFESIVAGSNIVCGISTRNLSMTCWGPEWSAENSTGNEVPFGMNEEEGTGPMGVVEYARPLIYAGDLQKVLDNRVGPPETHETEAVELMAYTALHCVNLEGKERPNMIDIVANLERALALCEETRPSFSTTTLSTPSD